MDGGAEFGVVRGTQQEALAVTLPTYESLQASPHLPGFSNPRYEVVSPVVDGEERREGEGGEEGRRGREEDEDEFDDLPPPYSPGLAGQESVFVAPPDYFTIFGQIREAREESTNHFIFLRRLCQIILNTVGCTVLMLIFMSIPITIFALGIHFLRDCPAEPNIPIFLVVGGISGALKNVALIFENIIKRKSYHISPESARRLRYVKFSWRVFNLVFNLFLMAWIVAGSYWIYHIYGEVDPEYEECHETLYKFAFGVITSSYILFSLMCCCMCFCGICLIQRRQGGGGGGEEGEESGGGGSEEGEREDSDTGEGTSGRSRTRSQTRSFGSGSVVSGERLPHSQSPYSGDRAMDSSERGESVVEEPSHTLSNTPEATGARRSRDRTLSNTPEATGARRSRDRTLSNTPEATGARRSRDRLSNTPEGNRRPSNTPEAPGTNFSPRRSHDSIDTPSSFTAAAPLSDVGDGGGGRRHVQPALSLDDLDPVVVVDYESTPVLSPRTLQLPANEPLSPRTTSV